MRKRSSWWSPSTRWKTATAPMPRSGAALPATQNEPGNALVGGAQEASWSHTSCPRWYMVTLTPSCADLVSLLWPTRWPWGGRLRTGCRATSPRPSGWSLRRYVLPIPGLGVGSCGSGQFRGASDSQGTWALHVAQCLFFNNLISLGSVSGLGFPDNLSGVGTALDAPWIRAPLSSATLWQAQVGSSHWT